MRVVSLIASGTEIVASLGLASRLVGRSHECDWPAEVLGLPKLTRARLDASAPSAEIDRQVRDAAQKRLSLYEVDGPALEALRPDVVLTQVQCDVCAVSPKDVLDALGASGTFRPELVPLGGADLEGVFADVLRVAKALGEEGRGRELVASLRDRLDALRRASALRARPRVACLEWLDPPMASGNWMPELVEAAGGTPLFGEKGKHSPEIAWADLLQADPDVIVLLPCGFDLKRTLEEARPLALRPGWKNLRAVREGRVFAADGNAYFNRPGPRLVDSAELLAEMFRGTPRGDGYLRLDPSADRL